MELHEYWLIKIITTTGHKNPIQIVDSLCAFNLREAENDFQVRNDFQKLLIKANLTIVESKKFYS